MDAAVEGLLDGLKGKHRAARQELLESLLQDGFSAEELQAAAAENRLPLLPVQRVLGGELTAAEVAEQIGASAQEVERIRHLLGLPVAGPQETVFSQEDVEAARSRSQFVDAGFSQSSMDEITRLLGESMARVSAATAAAFAEAFLQPGDTELDVARRFAQRARELGPRLDAVLVAAYRAHLRDQVRLGMISRAELQAGQLAGEQDLAVCFADLVGFTRLGGELEPGELGTVVSSFGGLAAEVAGPGVRLVKTIGDAAMFASAEAPPLVNAALDLVEGARQADLPSLRAGVAFGPTLPRAGDLYGQAVNLASRVTGAARPGSVLCTKEVHDSAPEEFAWSFAKRHRLKGIGESVPLYRARRRDLDQD